MVNRSVLECLSDIQVDITEAELATLPEITQQVCERFAEECDAERADLARFAKVEYHETRSRQMTVESEEDRHKAELEHARSVLA
jgi:hypothetical protein